MIGEAPRGVSLYAAAKGWRVKRCFGSHQTMNNSISTGLGSNFQYQSDLSLFAEIKTFANDLRVDLQRNCADKVKVMAQDCLALKD